RLAALQLTYCPQQHVILGRMMRRAGGIVPSGAGMVVALGAHIDVRFVMGGKRAVGWHEVIVRRSYRVAQLRRVFVRLVRIVARDANDPHGVVAHRQRSSLQQTQARGTRMATPAIIDLRARRPRQRPLRVSAGPPILESRMTWPSMTSAANGRRNFSARPGQRIVWISRVTRGRPVAILALNAFQTWCLTRAAKSCR